ncbi:MAG: Flagellar assembly factor FliW [Candidatus Dichloromethanomonas elyunquensis]|nr:MAG: Flagellar assembly factor FliW [Candidatus Dichloromethanomonas elyunquensis]
MNNQEKKTIVFSKGIPGFEEEKTFLFGLEEGAPLAKLDAVNNQEISFVLLQSQMFFPEYLSEVDLTPDEMELLGIDTGDKLDVWSIMTISLSNMSKSTVNLRAPLLLNFRTNKGIQIILSDENYSFRQQVFADAHNASEAEPVKEGAVG